MEFRGFTLDKFQENAAYEIDKGNSVVVSAATGTGKTLIADYVIDKYHKNNRIIYTSPIKALSNQKYRDFKKLYGEDTVGLITGDVVINHNAPLLIMTTEIYRNMLLTKDEIIDRVKYVVFDEIHYINDIERGTIWEESVIFSPEHIRFLCLSATITNAKEFASWIQEIKKHTVTVVSNHVRAVPLKHYIYDRMMGVKSINKFKEEMDIPDYYSEMGGRRGRRERTKPPYPEDLIKMIKDKLPCLFFVFSRAGCEKKAEFAAKRKFNFLSNKEMARVAELSAEIIPHDYRSMASVRKLKQLLPQGIAFHHAGMLPFTKQLVEQLFSEGLIKLLFATETFAVGINMPAKSVAFNSLYKYDGIHFRYLNSMEYFQMAGRAGRRGIDDIGYVFTMFNRQDDDIEKIKKITSKNTDPIKSQFKLSINTTINIINNYTDRKTREVVLKSSFDYYQKKKEKGDIRIMSSFNNRKKKLTQLGYIKNNNLTAKGMFARKIYDQELLVTELFCSDFYKHLSNEQLIVLAATIIYEQGKADYFERKDKKKSKELIGLLRNHTDVFDDINKRALKGLYTLFARFYGGAEFADLLSLTNLSEGDIIRLFRRAIDLLRQVRHATMDLELKDKCGLTIHEVMRAPIKVEL